MSDFDEFDDVDELGKATVYLPRQTTRPFNDADSLRRWILSLLERGHYITSLRLSNRGRVVLGEGVTTAPDPELQTFRGKGGARPGAGRPKGTPKQRAKWGSVKAAAKRKRHTEAQQRYRERLKQQKQKEKDR